MTTMQSADALTEGRWVLAGYIWRWCGEKRQQITDAHPAKCGTDAGYYRHRRKLREDACSDCKAAHTSAERRRKTKNLGRDV